MTVFIYPTEKNGLVVEEVKIHVFEIPTNISCSLYTGGAYLPIDISYPKTLIQSIFSDAEPKAILTKDEFTHNLEGNFVVMISIVYLWINSSDTGIPFRNVGDSQKVTLTFTCFIQLMNSSENKFWILTYHLIIN